MGAMYGLFQCQRTDVGIFSIENLVSLSCPASVPVQGTTFHKKLWLQPITVQQQHLSFPLPFPLLWLGSLEPAPSELM